MIGVLLDFYQSYRSQSAVQRLEKLIVTTATVRRDGKLVEVPFGEIVSGDVVALGFGELVPADCRLIDALIRPGGNPPGVGGGRQAVVL